MRGVQGNKQFLRQSWDLDLEPGLSLASCITFSTEHAMCQVLCKRLPCWRRRKDPSLWFQANHPFPRDFRKNRSILLLQQQLSLRVRVLRAASKHDSDPCGDHLVNSYHRPGPGDTVGNQRLYPILKGLAVQTTDSPATIKDESN